MIEVLTDPKFWISLSPAILLILVAGGIWTVFRRPELATALMQSPTLLRDIGLALGVSFFLILIYLYVLRPQIRINTFTRIDTQCPDRWSYNSQTKQCHPNYRTDCKPFRPEILKSFSDQCDFASACGTTWGGQCV